MRFKLDENLPRDLADDLVSLGHESDTVHDEGLAGAEDAAIVHAARTSSRILMTLDKGIASLLQYPVHGHSGVVLFRPDATGRRAVLAFVRTRLSELLEMELVGRLTVVGPTRIRTRWVPAVAGASLRLAGPPRACPERSRRAVVPTWVVLITSFWLGF